MASSLHYVTPLQLSDTFNEWFLRSNSLIDVVNKINVYNVENGWGLSRYRGIDGTTVLRLNIGQGQNEYDGTAVAGDYTYGLRFIDDTSGVGSTNPDVSAQRKILTLDFLNLPQGTGGSGGLGNIINGEDVYAVASSVGGTGAITKVKAGNMLPYGISGDHRFYGNVYFDGNNTVINSTEVNIDDLHLNLATSNTGDSGIAYLNDANLDGAGIIIKGSSGDKEFIYDYYDAGSTAFSSFKPNIDLQISTSSRILSEDKTLDLMAIVDDNFDVALSQLNDTTNIWKIRKNNLSDGQGRLIFFHENTVSSVTQDAMSLTKAGTIQLGNAALDGGFTSGGVYYDSTFSYLPKSYGIPTTGMSGDVALHYKWTNRKLVHQTAHGFTAGDALRFFPYGTTYDRAWNASKESAEVVAIVESDNGGSADSFVAVYNGLVDLTEWNVNARGVVHGWSAGDGTTMSAGQVYFLSNDGASGGWTADEPTTTGLIRKPVLLAVGETKALFINYLGNEVSTADISASATGAYVFSSEDDGYLVSTNVIPNQGFKNKIINGDFSFWQRAEDGTVNGSHTKGAIDWDGTTGTRFVNDSTTHQYTADMWILDTRLGTKAEVQKYGHTAGTDTNTTDSYTTEPKQYVRVLNNNDTGANKSYFMQRIEDVKTLAPKTGTNYVTVSYWSRGVSAATLPVSYVTLHQVFDGNSGANNIIGQSINNATGDYGGGATFCLGYASGTTLPLGVTVGSGTNWAQNTNVFIINNPDTMIETAQKGVITGSHDSAYSWLELRFEIPQTFGVSGGIDISRVQLEGGDDVTDFEQRPLQVEEQLVNRYYQRHTVGFDGYALGGGTFGTFTDWKTTPYPYSGSGLRDDESLISKCTTALNIRNANCNVAATNDVLQAYAGKGFRAGRTGAAIGMVEMLGTYHFDFSIQDS